MARKPFPKARRRQDVVSPGARWLKLGVRRLCLVCALAAFISAPQELQAQSAAIPEGLRPEAVGVQAPAVPSPTTGGGTDEARPKTKAPPGITPGATADPNALASEANNPAAPLTLIQVRDILVPSVPGTNGATNLLQIQPVIPMGPFGWFRHVQLLKINVQVPSLPSPVSKSGFGDLDVFDLVSIKTSWGRVGFGPALVFPTASSKELGAGKWQAGPAVALIYTRTKNLIAGAVLQNPISFAGIPDRPKVNTLIVAPTLTYNLAKGWFTGLADFNWTFNWEAGGAATIPLGVQVGKIQRIGSQPFNISVEVGRAAARPAHTPNPGWIFGFELSPIFNWHLGPGQKIHLRGKKKS